MPLPTDFINLLILLGAIQGLILGCLLLLSRTDERPGRYFLAFFMLILVYNGFETLNWSTGWNHDFFSCYVFTLIFGVGPSLYWYVRSFTRSESITLGNVGKHYLPVAVQFAIRSVLVLHLVWGGNRLLTFQLSRWHEAVSEPLSCLLTCIYVLFAWREFRRFCREGLVRPDEEKTLTIRWLRVFLFGMVVLMGFWVFSLTAPYILKGPSDFSFYYPTEVLLVVLIYWIGFTGYQRTKIVRVPAPKPSSTPVSELLSETEIQRCIEALTAAMQTEKLYLDPELSVGKLAAHLQSSPKTISALLNQHLRKGFNEFVNDYRIGEVKRQLLNPDKRHLTISGIALECGFNSQATFQRVFKAAAGMTPKEFVASQANGVLK